MTTFHEIAQRQRGHIARAQLTEIGMTDRQIERLVAQLHWQVPHPGVYRTGSKPPDWEDRVQAALLACGGDARAMGRTAARIYGLDGAERHGIIELTVGVLRGPAPTGVFVRRTRRVDPALTSCERGLAVSCVNQTLLEYAWLTRRGGTELAARAVEDAFRRGKSDEGPLRRFLAGCGRGVSGVRLLRTVLDKRPEGRPARSGFEVIVLSILEDAGLRLPMRRPLVSVPPDRKFECDLAYLDKKIDIEAMGEKWHATPRQRAADAERRRVLESLGWIIVEVGWHEAIFTPWVVVERVRAALRSRA